MQNSLLPARSQGGHCVGSHQRAPALIRPCSLAHTLRAHGGDTRSDQEAVGLGVKCTAHQERSILTRPTAWQPSPVVTQQPLRSLYAAPRNRRELVYKHTGEMAGFQQRSEGAGLGAITCVHRQTPTRAQRPSRNPGVRSKSSTSRGTGGRFPHFRAFSNEP